jgi:hypothetical protein
MESWIPEEPVKWASLVDTRAFGLPEAVQEVRGEVTTFTTAQKAEESSRREPYRGRRILRCKFAKKA